MLQLAVMTSSCTPVVFVTFDLDKVSIGHFLPEIYSKQHDITELLIMTLPGFDPRFVSIPKLAYLLQLVIGLASNLQVT